MLELFKKIIFGHLCKWKIIEKNDITEKQNSKSVCIGTDFTLQCTECGNLKFKKQRF